MSFEEVINELTERGWSFTDGPDNLFVATKGELRYQCDDLRDIISIVRRVEGLVPPPEWPLAKPRVGVPVDSFLECLTCDAAHGVRARLCTDAIGGVSALPEWVPLGWRWGGRYPLDRSNPMQGHCPRCARAEDASKDAAHQRLIELGFEPEWSRGELRARLGWAKAKGHTWADVLAQVEEKIRNDPSWGTVRVTISRYRG